MIKDLTKLDPKCLHHRTKILKKEKGLMYIWYKRECLECGGQWLVSENVNPDFKKNTLFPNLKKKLK